MNILIVQPYEMLSEFKHDLWKKFICEGSYKFFIPCLTLQQLYALTPEEHSVDILDERIGRKIDFEKDYDLVAISFFISDAYRSYKIAEEFKKRNKTVVMGGYHPSLLPEEAKKYCDSVVIGEAEYIWPKLLDDYKKGDLKPFYKSLEPVKPEDIPPAKRDKSKNYHYAAIQATRGCPNLCEFCSITHTKFGHIVRKRPIDHVIDELETIEQKRMHFYDPSMTSDPRYTKELFKKMKHMDKKFTCNGNVNVLHKDGELLKLASEAGCKRWYIGFESFSQNNINIIGKKTNKIEEYKETIKNIRDYGMDMTGHFIFGYDSDGPDVFDKTLKKINEISLTTIEPHVATPFPGTPYFDRLDKEGRIITKDWSKYTMNQVVFKPGQMTAEELTMGMKQIKENFYSFHNLFEKIKNYERININVLVDMVVKSSISSPIHNTL